MPVIVNYWNLEAEEFVEDNPLGEVDNNDVVGADLPNTGRN
jgi:hypothetical protein